MNDIKRINEWSKLMHSALENNPNNLMVPQVEPSIHYLMYIFNEKILKADVKKEDFSNFLELQVKSSDICRKVDDIRRKVDKNFT